MLKEIVIAVQGYFQAHRFITKHRLWKWILVPGLIYAILFTVSLMFFGKSCTHAIDYLFYLTGLQHWMQTMQDSPWLRFLFVFGQVFLYMLLMLFYISLFKYIILIIGAPLFSYLSEKTEAIIEGKDIPFNFSLLISDTKRGIKQALRNVAWQTGYIFSLLIVSFIPIVGCIAPLIGLMTEFYYLGFSMVDYSCVRNGISTSQSTLFISKHKGLAIGNGIVFYFMHLFIGVGWVLAPSYSIIAATLSIYNIKDDL